MPAHDRGTEGRKGRQACYQFVPFYFRDVWFDTLGDLKDRRDWFDLGGNSIVRRVSFEKDTSGFFANFNHLSVSLPSQLQRGIPARSKTDLFPAFLSGLSYLLFLGFSMLSTFGSAAAPSPYHSVGSQSSIVLVTDNGEQVSNTALNFWRRVLSSSCFQRKESRQRLSFLFIF